MEELLKILDDLDARRKFEHSPTIESLKASADFQTLLAGHWYAIRHALALAAKERDKDWG